VRALDWNPKQKFDHVKDRLKYYSSQLKYCEKQINKHELDVMHYTDKIQDIEDQILGMQSRIKHSSKTKDLDLNLFYGYDVEEFSSKILAEHENEFRSLPIGPIAFFLDVKDKKFGIAAQHCLSPLLKQYIVTCEEDKATLENLFTVNKVHVPGVIVLSDRAQTKRYNMRRRVDESFVTLSDVLTLHQVHAQESKAQDIQKKIFCLLEHHEDILPNNTILVRTPQAAAQIMASPPHGIIKCCSYDGTIFVSSKKKHNLAKSTRLWIDDKTAAADLKVRIPQLRADIRRLKQQQKGVDKTMRTTRKRMEIIRTKMAEKRRILPDLRENARQFEQNRPRPMLRISARTAPQNSSDDMDDQNDADAFELFQIMIQLPLGGARAAADDSDEDDDPIERIAMNPMMALLHLIAISGMFGEEQRGVSQETIEKHSTKFILTNIEQQLPANSRDCRICLSDFVIREEIRKLECDHCFHVGCVDNWLLERSSQCPLCRSTVGSDEEEDESTASEAAQAQ